MERPWNGHCHRCGTATSVHTMSRFNTDLICLECEEAEQKHPRYAEAHDAEERAVLQGNYNFPGIGKPFDL